MKANQIISKILQALVNEGGSATFATIQAVVEVKTNKTKKDVEGVNPFYRDEIRKRVNMNVLLNANYGEMVRRRQAKEGINPDFEAIQNWMVKVADSYNGNICTHRKDAVLNEDGTFKEFAVANPRLYLMVYCNTNVKTKTLGYYINGRKATDSEISTIKKYMPDVKEGKQGGTSDKNKVIVRTITISNPADRKGIEMITANKLTMEFDNVL